MDKDVAPLPGYPTDTGLLLAILEDARADWRLELDYDGSLTPTMGPEVMAWRPWPGGPNLGCELLHIAGVEVFWFEQVVLGREIEEATKRELLWDEVNVDECKWPDPPAEPLSWYLDLLDRYRVRVLESMKSWPALDSQIKGKKRTYSPRWVLGHVIQHESYHGGQVVLLYELWKRR